MPAYNPTSETSKPLIWTGRVLSALIVLFMLFDGVGKVVKIQPVIDGSAKLGYPESTLRGIGAAALAGAILYAIPQTAILGAILLTAFLGGAVATHVRVGDSNWWFAVLFGVVTWLGIYLRDAQLRALTPWRQQARS
jgi:hypothetical protein